ncbi:MAG TPA: methyltransferase domain-containing protein [Steroidobacteraceae bacterium]|nr:methyltransferase domain-containing protein [Steroidobacteraceae bacterium]
MSVRGIPAPSLYLPSDYWEDRARRFAAEGAGLAAVCAYGMPAFYNRAIHLEQYLALRRWLRVPAGSRVLDVGCGVGRWSRLLAARGAVVTGIDLSPTMIAQAQKRSASEGVAPTCRFQVQDVASLDVGAQFDLILGVTVLQHILDSAALRSALLAMTAHLAPGGRMVLLEAAPSEAVNRCDTSVFRARARSEYLRLIDDCGLQVHALTGVDPAPFRTWLLPYVRRLPRVVAMGLIALTTVLSLPVDAVIGRWAVQRSWHAVFVLERKCGGGGNGH